MHVNNDTYQLVCIPRLKCQKLELLTVFFWREVWNQDIVFFSYLCFAVYCKNMFCFYGLRGNFNFWICRFLYRSLQKRHWLGYEAGNWVQRSTKKDLLLSYNFMLLGSEACGKWMAQMRGRGQSWLRWMAETNFYIAVSIIWRVYQHYSDRNLFSCKKH